MKILIAPDSLKGSLTAAQFCDIVSTQLLHLSPNNTILAMPLADGGEGTIDAVLTNSSGNRISLSVKGPLGADTNASYGLLHDEHTAVIEMAQASGLPLIDSQNLDPLKASSYGTGELIMDALKQGSNKMIIGLGGSATNDGGSGMLAALGVRFLDDKGNALLACGKNLQQIHNIDISNLDSRLSQCDITIAGDVTNPLLGPNGATYVFGPQKGADKEQLRQLEAGMENFARKASQALGLTAEQSDQLIQAAGSGAAGGMGFSLMAFFQARMKSGFELIAEMASMDELFVSASKRPDLIITGEGRFDGQSLQGKLIGRLSERAEQYNIPLIILCGSIGNDVKLEDLQNNISVFSFCSGPMPLATAINQAPELLSQFSNNLAKLIFHQ